MADAKKLIRLIVRLENQVSKEADKVANSLQNIGKQMQSIGAKGTALVTAPIVAGMGSMVKAAMDWESAFAGVRKTVDLNADGFAILEQQLRSLATDSNLAGLENAHQQIAMIAEQAGQLGIKAKDITAFTEVVGELTMATDLTADSAATMIAQFANVAKLDMSRLRDFGDVLVTLGNNAATTESQILAMAQRFASISNIGFNPDEIAAYASTLSSLGISAELGGTNFMKAVNDISTAVATGGDKLKQLADLADMTAQQFKQSFETDAAGSIQKVIEGLSDLPYAEQIAALEKLGLTGSEMQRVMLSLANNTGLLRDQLNLASDAYAGNNALMKEAEQRATTAQANWNKLLNALTELRIEFGNELLPIFTKVVEALIGVIKWFTELPKPIKQGILIVAGLAAVLFPLISIIGGIISAVGAVSAAFSALAPILATVAGAIAGLSLPVALAIAAIVALVAAYATNFMGFRDLVNNTIRFIIDGLILLAKFIVNPIGTIIDLFKLLFNGDGTLGLGEDSPIVQGLKSFRQAVIDFANDIPNKIKNVVLSFSQMALNIIKAFEQLKPAMKQVGVNIITGLIEGVTSMIAKFIDMVKDLAQSVVDTVKGALKIKSPSQVMQGLGEQVVAGFNKGIDSMDGIGVNVNGTSLSSGSSPTVAASGGRGGAGNIYINGLQITPPSRDMYEWLSKELAKSAQKKGASRNR